MKLIIFSILSLLLLSDFSQSVDHSRKLKKGKKLERKEENAGNLSVKDLSWLVGKWYPCKIKVTGDITGMPGPLLVEQDAPYTFGALFEFFNAEESGETVTRLTADYYENLNCALLALDESDCPMWDAETGGLALAKFNFVATSSFSKKRQEELVLIGRGGSYININDESVPFKPTVSINNRVLCDGSQEQNGRLFCDIEVYNVHDNGFASILATSQYLVDDPSKCQYNPEDEM